MGGRTFERKAPFATTPFKKGGGRIFKGGLIFGRLWYITVLNPIIHFGYIILHTASAERVGLGEVGEVACRVLCTSVARLGCM